MEEQAEESAKVTQNKVVYEEAQDVVPHGKEEIVPTQAVELVRREMKTVRCLNVKRAPSHNRKISEFFSK